MNKLEQAAQQILEALEGIGFISDYWNEKVTTLREALAEQAEQEPVGDVKALDYAILTLHSIACLTQSDNLLWWQERARSALARIDELLRVRPVATYQEPASRAILCPPPSPEVYQMRSRDAFEAGWWEAQRQKAVSPISPVQQAKQEPVAYVYDKEIAGIGYRKDVAFIKNVEIGTDLYASPVRTKDLTDDEIEEIGKSYFDEWSFGFARAVIAAFKEKNK